MAEANSRATGKKNNKGANLSYVAQRWAAADKIRGNVEPPDYKHVVQCLIFLRYTSDAIWQYKACLPSEQLLRAYQAIVQPFLDRVGANICRAPTLEQTRDLLLPILMPGEIRLREAEKAVEAVT